MADYMLNGKAIIFLLIVGLIKKISSYKISCFPEPYTSNKNKIKVELDLCNYVTKFDLKNATGVDTLDFAKKSDLATIIFIMF